MKIGFFGINSGLLGTDPAVAAEVARTAEQLGYDSLWAGEHMCLPRDDSRNPVPPEHPFLDPLPALVWAAAHTSQILLATGVLLLPQRNPVALAKEVASVDVLSGGRLLLGIGVGYLEPEFRAVGAQFARRGVRTDEYLAAMHALWSMERPEYHGEFVDFGDIEAQPRTVRPQGPPIVVGGHSKAAFRRTVRFADEWYGFHVNPAGVKRCLAGLAQARDEYGLGRASERLVISVSPNKPVTPALVAEFAELGVDRVVIRADLPNRDDHLRFLEENAPERLVR